MAARTEILIEQIVVAVDIGLRAGRQLLALARGLDLGLRALLVEPVELGADGAAALSTGQRRGARIAVAIAVRASRKHRDGRSHSQAFQRRRHRAGHECLLHSTTSDLRTYNHNTLM